MYVYPTASLVQYFHFFFLRSIFYKPMGSFLLGLAVLVFLITASPGILGIYYKEVSIQRLNGITVLDKVYGPLHILYPVYLLSYFAVMVGVALRDTPCRIVPAALYDEGAAL